MTVKPLKKIAIVDDDEDILKIVEFSLESMPDVTIKYFTSGQDAIKESFSFQPDLMLIDVMMPNMSGIAMVEAMRLIPALATIPVIFFTAKIQKANLEECYRAGAKDVIQKPFDPMTLAQTILDKWEKINQQES